MPREKSSVYCGMCCQQICDLSMAETAGTACKHKFHTMCIMVRCCLQAKSDVKGFIADKCPVCPVPLDSYAVLVQINKKLDLLTVLDSKLTGLTERVDKIQDSYISLENRVSKLESRRLPNIESSTGAAFVKQVANCIKATTDINIEKRQLELETRMLSDQFVISGVSETISETTSSNLVHTVVRLGSLLGVPDLAVDCFHYVDRIGKKGGPGGSRDIIVKCKSPQLVGTFVSAKKKHRDFTANILYPQLDKIPIYVSKRYPSTLYKLRQSVIKKYPAINRRNVWIAGSSVCIKLKEGSEPIKVYPSTDLGNVPGLSA